MSTQNARKAPQPHSPFAYSGVSEHDTAVDIPVDLSDTPVSPDESQAFLLVKQAVRHGRPGAPPPAHEPAAGFVIAGKYRLEAPLAGGGMGTIWMATHIELDTAIAIKLMAPSYAASPQERSRFKREARTAAQLRSKHVVSVLDYGIDNDIPYIVMEKLEGEDLCDRLNKEGPMSLRDAAELLIPIAGALAFAHAKGIIHRDLKPENIFLARIEGETSEILKVLDFGLSKELRPSFDYDLTSTGVAMGTPAYMSPEQVLDARQVDHRSDLWSLAVLLFRVLTGYLPFTGSDSLKILEAVLEAPIPSASSLAAHLGPQTDAFFARALCREREGRFQSIQELNAAFQALAAYAPFPRVKPAPGEYPSGNLSSRDFVAVDVSQIPAWKANISQKIPKR